MSKNKKLPPETIVEVVLSKEMTAREYDKLLEKPKKGWSMKAYQQGFRK